MGILPMLALSGGTSARRRCREEIMTNLPVHHEDHPAVVSPNARIGLALLVLYFAAFVGLLLLNVFSPQVMSETELAVGQDHVIILWGTNVGVVYGVGLIVLAVALAIIYMRAVPRRG
jgi:predicted membrane protein